MVELSELSAINRREGYAAGDMALQAVARTLERTMAGTAATIGRYSGRRLAVVLPATGHTGPPSTAPRPSNDWRARARWSARSRRHGPLAAPGTKGRIFARARLALEAAPAVT